MLRRCAAPPTPATSSSRDSALSPPFVRRTRRSTKAASPSGRRAATLVMPTLRVTLPTRSTRAGRCPPGQTCVALWVPSVTSQCMRSAFSSAAGGGAGGALAAEGESPAARERQGADSMRHSTSAPGRAASAVRACARPSASRVPPTSRVSMLGASSTQSVMRVCGSGHCGPASASASSAASRARRRQAGSGGCRAPSAGHSAGAARHIAARATGTAARGRPPRCSQRITGASSSPSSQAGAAKLSNAGARGPGAAAASAARLLPRPSR